MTSPAQGIRVALTVSAPKLSTSALSTSYGAAPQHGYYLTFTVTVVNTGSSTLQIGPLDFAVRVRGGPRTTPDDGNAPYSGAKTQLDNTFLDPGERLRAPLSFDVSGRHGHIAYAPSRKPAVIWAF